MKLKEMVELVQQHHPELGVTEIVKMLNTAQEEYSQRTRMLESATQFPLTDGLRYYKLDESILEIKSVDMEGADGSTDHVNIPKLIGRPVRRDLT
jgi:DNA-directed RNA polymerase specialized sigma subunit